MSDSRDVTHEELERFKARVWHWADRFGLKDWLISVRRDRLEYGIYANCDPELSSRLVVIRLNERLPADAVDDLHMDWFALHEVLELVLMEFKAAVRGGDESTISSLGHQVIHRVMRALDQPEMDPPDVPEPEIDIKIGRTPKKGGRGR